MRELTTTTPRIESIVARDPATARLVDALIAIARKGLSRMYKSADRCFSYTCRRRPNGDLVSQGTSIRYSGIALLGAQLLPLDAQQAILAGETAQRSFDHLLERLSAIEGVGDVALLAWTAAELEHPALELVIQRLRELDLTQPCCKTYEAAWVLSALIAAHAHIDVEEDVVRAAARLLGAYSPRSRVFTHCLKGTVSRPWRAHAASFADQVYPIQALARHHRAFSHEPSLVAAARCAEQICKLQGDAGQWWWQYDTRTGRVIEEYPVYTVHQDAMGPIALMDLHEAGGPDHADSIRRGLSWVQCAPEVGCSLIDEQSLLIWRKVGRADPRKLVRGVRAAATKAHSSLRLRWLDRVFPPTRIDYECRPYHLGWILYAWLGGTG